MVREGEGGSTEHFADPPFNQAARSIFAVICWPLCRTQCVPTIEKPAMLQGTTRPLRRIDPLLASLTLQGPCEVAAHVCDWGFPTPCRADILVQKGHIMALEEALERFTLETRLRDRT